MIDRRPAPSRLILASSSPRRVELIGRLGLTVAIAVDPADVDETPHPDEAPLGLARRLAELKARTVAARHGSEAVILAADTVVAIGATSFGQPVDEADATRMLRALSGRTHEVHTAVCVGAGSDRWMTQTTSSVHIRSMRHTEVAWYIATGEPFGKAGAYAVQGIGGLFVQAVEGSVSGVIGLPLAETADLLRSAGLAVAGDES